VSRHRRRAVVLGAISVVLVLLALGGMGGSSSAVRPTMQQVVVVRRPLAAGAKITAADLAVHAVAAPWASPHQLSDPGQAIGRRAAVALAAGAPLMDSELGVDTIAGARDVTVRLDDAAGLPVDPPDGGRADLYLVLPGRPPQVRLVLAGAPVVASRTTDGAALATLRVSRGEVRGLLAAEAAGSLRLVSRSGA
jgi:Flp pilus assembly protein CpaB